MMSPRERYIRDPAFSALVGMIAKELKRCMFTPTEMREAVILAAVIVAEELPVPPPIPLPVIKWFEGLQIMEQPSVSGNEAPK